MKTVVFTEKTEMFGKMKTLNMRLRQYMVYLCFSSHLQEMKYMNNAVVTDIAFITVYQLFCLIM